MSSWDICLLTSDSDSDRLELLQLNLLGLLLADCSSWIFCLPNQFLLTNLPHLLSSSLLTSLSLFFFLSLHSVFLENPDSYNTDMRMVLFKYLQNFSLWNKTLITIALFFISACMSKPKIKNE